MRFDASGGFDDTLDHILEWLFGIWTIAHSGDED